MVSRYEVYGYMIEAYSVLLEEIKDVGRGINDYEKLMSKDDEETKILLKHLEIALSCGFKELSQLSAIIKKARELENIK